MEPRATRRSSFATCGTSTGARGRPDGSPSWPRRSTGRSPRHVSEVSSSSTPPAVAWAIIKTTPRKRAQAAPKAANLPKQIGEWCNKVPAEEKAIYPIDQADGGCDDGPQCSQGSPWRSQIATIDIQDADAISDSGAEIWNLLESRGISNVMLMGVHTNMCVLGRPFGLRNMARSGKNVALVRDLTDTMYNSRKRPYVSHFEGTNRIVEHIEKYVAPTITSTDLTGQAPFQFKPDDRPARCS